MQSECTECKVESTESARIQSHSADHDNAESTVQTQVKGRERKECEDAESRVQSECTTYRVESTLTLNPLLTLNREKACPFHSHFSAGTLCPRAQKDSPRYTHSESCVDVQGFCGTGKPREDLWATSRPDQNQAVFLECK